MIDDIPKLDVAVTEADRPTWEPIELAPLRVTAIASVADYQFVATIWKLLKARIEEIRNYFTPRKKKARDAYEQWLKDEHDAVDAYVEAERLASRLLGDYDARERQRAEAERRRLETEERAQAEADQFAAALRAEDEGCHDVAQEIMAEPIVVAPVRTVAIATPAVEGLTTTGRWQAQVVSLDRLIVVAAKEILDKRPKVAASLLKADPVALKRTATAMKGNLQAVADTWGLKVWEDRSPRRM